MIMAQRVLVTGATGFVATELCKQLLEKGYKVVGTVRKVQGERTQTLKKLGEALPGTLQLVEADLLTPGSFDTAVQDCTYVFHTASPFVIESDDPQKNIIDVAVKGTENVLSSVAKTGGSVRRVVLTSSVAAVHGEYGAPPKSGELYTEADYNETSTIEKGQAYHMSKVQAEKAAWRLAEGNFDLVTICPNFVLGPILSPEADSLSVGFIKGIVEGGKIEGGPIICDVRDVAAAHILAAESPSASGRYIISCKGPITPKFVSGVLRTRFPELSIQEATDDTLGDKMDNSRVQKGLGLLLRDPSSTLVDMAVTAIQLGLAKPTAMA